MMLIYINENYETKEFELVESKFDRHFKLSMLIHGATLKPGQYIVMIAPEWHKSAHIDARY